MNRRQTLLTLGALATLPLIHGCGKRDDGHGPAPVHWDRDACIRCNMLLSDRHYAAQIRGGPERKAYKFDDIGCALFWLKEQAVPWADAADTEIWVNDFKTGAWIDARSAHYLAGKTTPMLYGYGASAEALPGSVDFTTLRAAILARGR